MYVVDIIYVVTRPGFAYVSFVTDMYPSRIVGWNVASTLKAEVMPLRAIDIAARQLGGDLERQVHHSDHGSNYMSMVYTDKVAEFGAIPSTGTVGDRYDNSMAEAVNALYKVELIKQQGPWKTVEQGELAPSNTCVGRTMNASTENATCVACRG